MFNNAVYTSPSVSGRVIFDKGVELGMQSL